MTVQFDDLIQGQFYRFKVEDQSVIGRFGGFIREKGKPLILMVVQNAWAPDEVASVVSFPTTDVKNIFRQG